MISKLSVWAPSRPEAIARLQRALGEYVVKGITTNVRYLSAILEHPDFVRGDYDTGFLPRAHEVLLGKEDPQLTEVSVMAAAVYAHQQAEKQSQAIASTAGTTAAASRWRWSGRRR